MKNENLKPTHWHTNNTIYTEWFERDRSMVRITDTRDQEIICLFDDQVEEFVSDGFKSKNQSWHEALTEYATQHKLTTK